MKKYVLVLICATVFVCMLSACTVKQKSQTINYQRKLTQYLPNETPAANKAQTSTTVIDLSEGPKLRYDARLGPSDVNFDFKINTEY